MSRNVDFRVGDSPIRSISWKQGITVINIRAPRMLGTYGFLRALFEEATSAPAGSMSEAAARAVLGAALALAPDLGALARAAEPSAGRALAFCDVGGLVALLPHLGFGLALLCLPGGRGGAAAEEAAA